MTELNNNNMPDVIYAELNLDEDSVPQEHGYLTTFPSPKRHPYARIPKGIEPDDAAVYSRKVVKDADEVHEIALAAAEQKHAALAGAAREAEILVSTLTDPNAKVPGRTAAARELLPRLQAALAQQDQPAGGGE